MTAAVVALVVILLAIVVLAGASVRILREYERAVLFRLGRLTGVRGPGLILLIPVLDRIVRVSLRTVTLNVPPQNVITRDNVPAHVDAVVYFRVVDAAASRVAWSCLRRASSGSSGPEREPSIAPRRGRSTSMGSGKTTVERSPPISRSVCR